MEQMKQRHESFLYVGLEETKHFDPSLYLRGQERATA